MLSLRGRIERDCRVMLTFNEAKKIGIQACVEKLDMTFCRAHNDNSTSAYGEIEFGEFRIPE